VHCARHILAHLVVLTAATACDHEQTARGMLDAEQTMTGDGPAQATPEDASAIESDASTARDAETPCLPGCPFGLDGGMRYPRTSLSYCSRWPLDVLSGSSYEATLADWTTSKCLHPSGMGSQFPFLVEGSCANGRRMLYTGTGTTVERRYFDSEGAFQALETGSDGCDGCCGSWPTTIPCGAAEVTRVICGAALGVGSPIPH
jgi:hypothetical protein